MSKFLNRQQVIAFLLFAVLFTAAVIPQTKVWAAQPITVLVNGQAVNFDKQPEVVNDRVVVQIRTIAEMLGCSVVWNDDTQTSYINQPGVPLQQTAVKGNDIQVYVNNQPVDFPDQKPLMMNDYVMIPSRPVVEKLGCTIDWNDNTQTQTITSAGTPVISRPTPSQAAAAPAAQPSASITPTATPIPVITVLKGPIDLDELSLFGITTPIGLNETETVTLHGKPNTAYTIDVHYSTGISSAAGISGSDKTKTSDSNGYVSWSWIIDPKTAKQTHYLIVTGGGEGLSVEFEVR